MLFYTGTTLAGAMYIVGAVEIALVSAVVVVPEMFRFNSELGHRIFITGLMLVVNFVLVAAQIFH